MRFPRFVTLRSFVYALAIHAGALALMTLSIEFDSYQMPKPQAAPKIVKAMLVDERQVEAELQRFKEQQTRKEQQVKEEEQRLQELKKERKRLQREKKKEQQKLAEAEKKRKSEERKQKKAEAERKRLQDEQRKAAEKKMQDEKRLAQEQRKAQELRRQQELQAELAAEEENRLAQQRQLEDQTAIAEYTDRIRRKIESVFRNQPSDASLSGTIIIEMIPSGDVVSVRVTQSSGNDSFDQRAQTAVRKASPFSLPADPRLFQKMRRIEIEFEPGG